MELKAEELAKKKEDLEAKLEEALNKNKELEKRINELLKNVEEKELTIDIVKKEVHEEGNKKTQQSLDTLKVEHDRKIKELNNQITILQQANNRLTSEKGSLEIELLNNSRKVSVADSQSGKITHQVKMDQKSNIFGGLLKKTEGGTNKFLKEAQKEYKKTEEVLNIVWKDKIDDLKKLRENIVRMSPKTISTRSIPDCDYQNIDFDDEEAFKKMQDKLNEREKKYQEEKERLEKLRLEKELKDALK